MKTLTRTENLINRLIKYSGKQKKANPRRYTFINEISKQLKDCIKQDKLN